MLKEELFDLIIFPESKPAFKIKDIRFSCKSLKNGHCGMGNY